MARKAQVRKATAVVVDFHGLDALTRTHMRRVLARGGCTNARRHAVAMGRKGKALDCKAAHRKARKA